MKPIRSTAEAAGFAKDLLHHVQLAKEHAHATIEHLAPAVYDEDNQASDATLELSRLLNCLRIVEDDLEKVIAGSEGETAEVLS